MSMFIPKLSTVSAGPLGAGATDPVSTTEIVYVPYDAAYEAGFEDMLRRVPDLSKIREAIGYRPQVQLDRIVESVIEYTRSQSQDM